MKNKSYRPNVNDPSGKFQLRTRQVSRKMGMRVDCIQTKIYETGLAVFENEIRKSAISGASER